jgi:tetratricopeptide (TPR) repeat protein
VGTTGRQDRLTAAVDHYADAIALNDAFFYYQLHKGLAHQALNQPNAAQADLEASIVLFATADAHFALGVLAVSRGNTAAALEHYSVAADSNSLAGQAARDAMVRLDLPQNPGRYLQLAAYTDAQGQLIVQIGNPSAVTVTDLGLVI